MCIHLFEYSCLYYRYIMISAHLCFRWLAAKVDCGLCSVKCLSNSCACWWIVWFLQNCMVVKNGVLQQCSETAGPLGLISLQVCQEWVEHVLHTWMHTDMAHQYHNIHAHTHMCISMFTHTYCASWANSAGIWDWGDLGGDRHTDLQGILLENVPGFQKSEAHQRLRSALEQAGYEVFENLGELKPG